MRTIFSTARTPIVLLSWMALGLVAPTSLFAVPVHHPKQTRVATAGHQPGSVQKLESDQPTSTEISVEINQMEREFVDRINHERTSRGLSALTIDPTLVVTARGHSAEMCTRDYFDHHSPTTGLVTPMDRYLKTLHGENLETPGYLLVGENIYYCSTLNQKYNVAFGHQALMNSPGHRANILEPRFARIGVGTYQDAKGQFWVTEMFLRDTEPEAGN